ncbi:MAG: hypothetical protein MI867_28715 [Pseudomonadales bacterium]|nr:hypothetical protein [Pseudomonadales bacterium]
MTIRTASLSILVLLASLLPSLAHANLDEEQQLWRSLSSLTLVMLLDYQDMSEDELLWLIAQANDVTKNSCIFESTESFALAVPTLLREQRSLCEIVEVL